MPPFFSVTASRYRYITTYTFVVINVRINNKYMNNTIRLRAGIEYLDGIEWIIGKCANDVNVA